MIEILIGTLPCPVYNSRELYGLIRADETVNLTAGRKVIGGSVDQTNLGLSSIEIKGGRKVENDTRINRIVRVYYVGMNNLA